MSQQERYIVAIEISSSKIIGAVGRATPSGQLDIIAVEQEKAVDAVRFGVIRNLEDTSMRIARIIDKLERKPAVAPRKISSVFIGLSGRSMRSITANASLSLPGETEITDEILARLHSQASAQAVDSSLEVVDAVPRTYYVDKRETHNPRGMIGSSISAVYDLIVCRQELKRNIERTVADKLGMKIEGFVVTALACSRLILTDEDRSLGCMLVDLGAETTTVSIFKNNNMLYFATIPMGSRNITLDLTSLSILEVRAEDIKITSGNAIPSESVSALNLNGVRMSDISRVIVARAEEIAANIQEQTVYAGIDESALPAGIIGIGGGFKLNGMLDLVGSYIPARRGQLPSFVRVEETKAPVSEIIEVASILYAGARETDKECLEMPGQAELPATGEPNAVPEEPQTPKGPKKGNRILRDIVGKITNMFNGSGEDDDSDLME